ncbi:MAG: hypothetical protein FWH15_00630 [Betaproteobacteria bacterium]|nr:hypothetical protein [Betaproteobacteria bacterium]
MGNILLAHESKTVRATLKTYLKPSHKVLEASDSDAAWHLLVLRNDLNAVVAGPDLGMSTGMSLLERVRKNALLRLKNMPFYFIGSETRIAELIKDAKRAGANGFLHTGMKSQEVLDILNPAIGDPTESASEDAPEPEAIAKSSEPKEAPEPKKTAGKRAIKTGLIESAPMSPKLFEEAVLRQYSVPGQRGAILCCAIANYHDMVKNLGEDTATRIVSKLTKLAQTRIGSSDIISIYAPGVFAISTLGGTLLACDKFATQLKKNLAAAKIAVQGKPLSISIISAFAAIPEDGDLSGKEILELAKYRLVKTLHEAKKR